MEQGEAFFGRDQKSRHIGFLLSGGALLILAFVLTFPAGPDQTIYLTIGRSLSEGNLFYSQITDTKPPFIHFLFALAQILFGDGILGFRVIELLVQIGTLALIIHTLRRSGADWAGTGLAALIYALLYVSLGPDGTAQPEGFVGLFLLPMMLLQTGRRRRVDMVLIGVLAGFLFTAKFTLAAALGGAAAAEFLLFERQSIRRSFEHVLLMAAGVLLMIALFIGSLFALGVADAWREMSVWSSGRLGQITASTDIIEGILTQTGSYLAHGLGITLTILLGIAFARTLRRPTEEGGPKEIKRSRLNRLALLTMLFLLVSTLVELMFIHYQYSRIITPVALLTGPLLAGLFRSLSGIPRRPYEVILAIILVGAGILFSPFPRVTGKIRSGVTWRLSTPSDGSYDPTSDRRLDELGRIERKIQEESRGEPSVFALSEVAGFLYAALKTTPGFRTVYYYHLVSPWTPEKWEREFTEFVEATPPEFLVIELEAHDHTFSGGPEPTLDSLAAFEGLQPILQEAYREEMRTESFLLLRHREEGRKD